VNATDFRDHRAIALVECPRCHAPAGLACRAKTGIPASVQQGRPLCHSERRAAWTEWKRENKEAREQRNG
jgi:hypothetical protein